jgi:hypothetical protein
LIFGNSDSPTHYEVIDLTGRILDSGTIYPWTVALGTTATVEITSESNSHLPTVWGSPLHLPLPRYFGGLLLVRISTPKTNIVYKYLNYP